MSSYTGWAIRLTTKDWVAFMGILFLCWDKTLSSDFSQLMGIRSMVFRTRQQARDYAKQRFEGSTQFKTKIVKVKVYIEEIL